MNFRPRAHAEPEINLIPFIDVLLVVLIFLMLSTTYSKFTELQVKLPVANVDPQRDHPQEMIVAVSSNGRYSVNKIPLEGRSVEELSAAMTAAQQTLKLTGSTTNLVLIISADANATHQAVVTVMEAARRQGLAQITFATQNADSAR